MLHLGDITKIDGAKAPAVEVVIGGSPCQDLSIAGKRGGLAGERSGLFIEQVRIIKEMRRECERRGANVIIPRFMVWENVPGAFSSNGVEDFRSVIEETARIADASTAIPRPTQSWTNSGAVMGNGWSIVWRVLDAQFWGVPQRRRRIALIADFGGYTAPEILFERNGLSRNTTQGGTAWKDFASAIEERFGGANTTERKAGIEELSKENAPVVFDVDQITGTTCRSNPKPGDPCFTLHTYGGAPVLCFGNGQSNQMMLTDKAGTLDCMHDRHILLVESIAAVDCRNGTENKKVNGTLQAKSSGGTSLNYQNVVRINKNLRRLTPLEEERLQGYPDGWTDIGEWIDSKGKKHRLSDRQRYKAIGNSIALPPWAWILERLNNYCTFHTMASLFDGIGGFPLIWETLNDKGSCLWASEIEEFPIAVTKKRFNDVRA